VRYLLTMLVRNHPGFDSKPSDPPTRQVEANFYAESPEAAKAKARSFLDVERFKNVRENPE
jgi:hypothetical protein